jgi:hypothetical protein
VEYAFKKMLIYGKGRVAQVKKDIDSELEDENSDFGVMNFSGKNYDKEGK